MNTTPSTHTMPPRIALAYGAAVLLILLVACFAATRLEAAKYHTAVTVTAVTE